MIRRTVSAANETPVCRRAVPEWRRSTARVGVLVGISAAALFGCTAHGASPGPTGGSAAGGYPGHGASPGDGQSRTHGPTRLKVLSLDRFDRVFKRVDVDLGTVETVRDTKRIAALTGVVTRLDGGLGVLPLSRPPRRCSGRHCTLSRQTAYFVPDRGGVARVLGTGIGLAAGARGESVWLVRSDDGRSEVRRVDLHGRPRTGWSRLPRGHHLVRGTEKGLVLRSARGWELWKPGSGGDVVRRQGHAHLVAASRGWVAWTARGASASRLHLTSVVTGTDTVTRTTTTPRYGLFAPKDEKLAVVGPGEHPQIHVIDLFGNGSTLVPGGPFDEAHDSGRLAVGWSPSGKYLLIRRPAHTTNGHQKPAGLLLWDGHSPTIAAPHTVLGWSPVLPIPGEVVIRL